MSWNCGAEGVTNDAGVSTLRARQKRNLLTTLFLSQGVPMLLAGDELSHTQEGNNNAYCIDSELTWLDWNGASQDLLEFTRVLITLRKTHPVFQRQKFFQGRLLRGEPTRDILWYSTDGTEMSDEDWNAGFVRCLGLYLDGDMIGEVDQYCEPIVGNSLLFLLNAHHEDLPFVLPEPSAGARWIPLLDTHELPAEREPIAAGAPYKLVARSVALLSLEAQEPVEADSAVSKHVADEVLAAPALAEADPVPPVPSRTRLTDVAADG
jgi:glycogen operon protein